jgi:hypothetical protein
MFRDRLIKWSLTEAALVVLLRVKRGLLSLQISDQFFGPINCDLVVYREQYSLIPHNRFFDFAALFAHWNNPVSNHEPEQPLMVASDGLKPRGGNCSSKNSEPYCGGFSSGEESH